MSDLARYRGRYSIALGTAPRGAGLGNEIIAWGKSYVAARELGMKLLPPAWAFNRYRLHHMFGWSRRSLLPTEGLSRLGRPQLITEAMYRSTGETDYGRAVKRLVEDSALVRPRGSLVMTHQGMWGGYSSIRAARWFLRDQLMGAPGALQQVERWSIATGACLVGVHIRRGDFTHHPPAPGEFNRAIPLNWYVSIIESLKKASGVPLQFHVCTDATSTEIEPVLDLGGVSLVRSTGASAPLQDLAVLSEADLLIASVSSFSMLAAFLSGRPYIWYSPQLTAAMDALTIWGFEAEQLAPGSPTSLSLKSDLSGIPRGIPWRKGEPPDWLCQYFNVAAGARTPTRDLIFHGAVPQSSTVQ